VSKKLRQDFTQGLIDKGIDPERARALSEEAHPATEALPEIEFELPALPEAVPVTREPAGTTETVDLTTPEGLRSDYERQLIEKGVDAERAKERGLLKWPKTSGLVEAKAQAPAPVLVPTQAPEVPASVAPPEVAKEDEPIGPVVSYQERPTFVETKPVELPPVEGVAADHDIDMRGLLGALESGYRSTRDRSYREQDQSPSLTINGRILEHARVQGITVDQMRKQARRQDIPFDYMVKQVSRGKATAVESVDQSRERGELGFLGPEARKAAATGANNRRMAKDRFDKTGSVEDLEQVWGSADIGLVKSERDLPFMGVTSEEVVEGAKKGSESHDFALFLAEQLLKNEEVSRLVEKYGTHEMGFKYYRDKRAFGYMAQRGFTKGTPEWEANYPAAELRAYNELAALFTAGAWHGRIIIPTSSLVSTPEGREITKANRGIYSPTLEIVGMAKRGGRMVTVVREQGALISVFDVMDAPQSAVVGMIDAGEFSKEAAVRGMEQRRHFLELSMDSEFADRNMATKAAAIAGGGLGLIFFPDLLSLAGNVGKVAKLGVASVKTRKGALRSSELLETIYKAREENNFAKASEAEAALRREFGQDGGVADALDIVDADVASRMVDEFPDLLDPEFAASLPGTMGQRMMSLHASLRKQRLTKKLDAEGKSLVFANYKELFSTDLILADMQKMRDELVALGAKARLPAARRVIIKEMEGLRKLLNVADDADAARFMRRLGGSLHELFEDSGAWSRRFHGKGNPDSELLKIDALRGPSQDMIDAATGDARAALEALAKQLRKKRQKIHRLMGSIVAKTRDIKDPVPLLDRAIESVKTASETRAAAAEMLRQAILSSHRIIPNPVNPRPGDGELMPLSDYGARFADMIEEAFGLSREEAEVAARLTDARARAWASLNGKEIGKWYDTRIAAVRSLEDRSDLPKTALKMAEEQGDSPIFYSRLLAAAEAMRDGDIKIDSVVNQLRKAPKGIPKGELQWTGLEIWLQERKAEGAKTVTKQDVIQFLESHAIRVDSQVTGEAAAAVTKAHRAVVSHLHDNGLVDKIRATGLSQSEQHRLMADPTRLLEFSRVRVQDNAAFAQEYIEGLIQRHDELSTVLQTLSKKISAGGSDRTAAEWIYEFTSAGPRSRGGYAAPIPVTSDGVLARGTSLSYTFPEVMDEIVTIFRQARDEIIASGKLDVNEIDGFEEAIGEFAVFRDLDKRAEALNYSDEWYGLTAYSDNLNAAQMLHPVAATKYENFTVPGGEDYTEMTITLPAESRMPQLPDDAHIVDQQNPGNVNLIFPHGINAGTPGDSTTRYVAVDGAGMVLGAPASDTAEATRNGRIGLAGFFPESAGHEFFTAKQDVAVHVRFKTRIGANGEKVLFIEEIQSDWSQRARQIAKEAGMPSGHTITTAPPKVIMKAMNTRLKDLQAEAQKAYAVTSTRSSVVAHLRQAAVDTYQKNAKKLTDDINGELGKLGYNVEVDLQYNLGRTYVTINEASPPRGSGRLIDDYTMGPSQAHMRAQSLGPNPAEFLIAKMRELHNEQSVGIASGHFRPEQFPPTPLKDDWHKLMVKRVMRYAADNDFDSVALSRPEHVTPLMTMEGFAGPSHITDRRWWDGKLKKLTPNEYDDELRAWQQRNPYASLDEAEDFERSLRQRPRPPDAANQATYNGIKSFYEGTLPNYMKKYLRQWGGKQREMVVDISDAGAYHRGIDADAERARAYGTDWLTGRGADSRPLSANKIGELQEQQRAYSVIAFDITDEMRTGLKRPAPLLQVRGKDPVYYSKLTSVAENMPKRMAVDDLMGFLGRQPNPQAGQPMTYPRDVASKELFRIEDRKGVTRFKKGDPVLDKAGQPLIEPEYLYTKNVKEEEIKWTNVEEFLGEARSQGMTHVTRKDFLKHLAQNRVVVDSHKMGGHHPLRDALKEEANGVFQRVSKLLDDSELNFDPEDYHKISENPTSLLQDSGEEILGISDETLAKIEQHRPRASRAGTGTKQYQARPARPGIERGLIPELDAYEDILRAEVPPRRGDYEEGDARAFRQAQRRWSDINMGVIPAFRHLAYPEEWPAAARLPMVEAIATKLRHIVEGDGINPAAVRDTDARMQLLLDKPEYGLREATEKERTLTAVQSLADHRVVHYGNKSYVPDFTDAQARRWAEMEEDPDGVLELYLGDGPMSRGRRSEDRYEANLQRDLNRSYLRQIRREVRWLSNERHVAAGDALLDELKLQRQFLGDHIEAQRLARDPDFVELARLRKEIKDLNISTGDAPYSNWKLKGGTDYRVVLIKTPRSYTPSAVFRTWYKARSGTPGNFDDLPSSQQTRLMSQYNSQTGHSPYMDADAFVGTHWVEENVLTHYRATTRFDDAGRRVLFVEEIQSDWHQAGRARGYSVEENVEIRSRLLDRQWDVEDKLQEIYDGEATGDGAELSNELTRLQNLIRNVDKGPVPDGPFKDTKTWTDLALKHIFRQAADEGYDGVAFTRSDLANSYTSMPIKSAEKYYDGTVLSRAKRHTKAKQETIRIKGGKSGDAHIPARESFEDVPYFALTEKARTRVTKPQVLFQRVDTTSSEFRQWSGGAPVIKVDATPDIIPDATALRGVRGSDIPDGPVVIEAFHGTAELGPIKAFRAPTKDGIAAPMRDGMPGTQSLGPAIYHSSDYNLAKEYSERTFLNMEAKPTRLEASKRWPGEFDKPEEFGFVYQSHVKLNSPLNLGKKAADAPEDVKKLRSILVEAKERDLVLARKMDAEKPPVTDRKPEDEFYPSWSRNIERHYDGMIGRLDNVEREYGPGATLGSIFGDDGLIGTPSDISDIFRKHGYDGVISDPRVNLPEVVVFNPEQIRPAIKGRAPQPGDPEILYQRADTPTAAKPQTGWKFRELGDGSVELTSAEVRAAKGAPDVMGRGLTFQMERAGRIGRKNTMRIKTSELPEALQGRGMGSELYLRALQHAKDKGFRVTSDVNPSPEAMSVYNKLQEAGVPIRRELSNVEGVETLEFIIEADQLRNVNLDTVAGTLMKQRLDKTEMGRYSGLRLAATKLPDKVQTDAVLALLRKQGGVKADELKWVGVPGWLESMKAAGRKSLTRREIVQFMDENAVHLTVTRLARLTADEIPLDLRNPLLNTTSASNAAWTSLERELRAAGAVEGDLHSFRGGDIGRVERELTARLVTELNLLDSLGRGTDITGPQRNLMTRVSSTARDTYSFADDIVHAGRIDAAIKTLTELRQQTVELFALTADYPGNQVRRRIDRTLRYLRLQKIAQSDTHFRVYRTAAASRASAERAVARFKLAKGPTYTTSTIDGMTRASQTRATPPYEEIFIKHPFVADTTDFKTQQRPDGTWEVSDFGPYSPLGISWLRPDETKLLTGGTQDEAIAAAKSFLETHPGASEMRKDETFRHYHWGPGQENVLASIRLTERIDVNGNRVLFVEEIQSDWHQAGRAEGYIRSEADKQKIRDLVLQLQKQITPQSSLEDVQAAADQLNKLFYKVGGARSTRVAAVNANPPSSGVLLVVQGRVRGATKWQTTRTPNALAHEDLTSGLLLTKFAGGGGRTGAVKAAPFSKNWYELAIKQVLRKAADEGYHSVAFNKGDVVKSVVGGDQAGQRYFYDEMVPKVLRDYAQKQWGTPMQRIKLDWADEVELDRLRQSLKPDGSSGTGYMGMGQAEDFSDAAAASLKRYRFLNADEGVVGIRISDEMRGSINAGQTMFQGEEGVIKGAVQFAEDGKATIFALKQGDISTVVHELGHIFRRDLGAVDLRVTEKWAGVVDGKWTVEAEEKFARAFERYLREGEAPDVGLRTVFEKLKVWLSEIYRNVVGTPIDVELTDEVRQVFKNLLSEQPPNRPPLKRVSRYLDKELFGPPGDEGVNALEQLAAEALRVGATDSVNVDFLLSALAKHDVIHFNKPVMGKTSWTKGDLAKLQSTVEAEVVAARRAKPPSIPLRSMSEAIAEETPDQKIRSAFSAALDKKYRGPEDYAIAGIAAIARASVATVLGGDEFVALRNLPPAVRHSVLAGTRTVEQAYGDMIRLVGEGDINTAAKFLGGETVKFKNGRDALSSGFDATGAVMQDMNRWATAAMSPKHRDALIRLARNINEAPAGRSGVGVELSADKDSAEAIEWFFGNASGANAAPRFLKQIREALEVPDRIRPSHEMRLIEVFLHHAGVTERAGKLSDARGVNMAKALIDDIEKIYGKEDALRIAVLFAGYGQAVKAKQRWAGLGMAISKADFDAYHAWLNGMAVPKEMQPKMRAIASNFGMNPNFLKDAALDVDMYIPAAARNRMAEALARGSQQVQVSGKLTEQFYEDKMRGAWRGMYQYLKTRMTRGGFFVRQRYFLMNTIDHFTQMAISTGFRPAFVSTIRMTSQNFMVLPGVAHAARLAEAVGVEKASERMRQVLQSGGDRMANAVGEMMGMSKYRIEVNPILEGIDGTFTVTDAAGRSKIYKHRDIRDIAVEEGIFASFDTRALERSIKRAVNLQSEDLIEAAQGGRLEQAAGGTKRIVRELTDIVAETAEAWSERERLGAMITLMEAGMSPRDAARMAIDALYDYAGSMSKVDRHILVNLMFPFWAFQKNANRQILNTMFSPAGAYRMGVMRRAQEGATHVLTELLYDRVSDPYGVDWESMPKELQDNYWALRQSIEYGYGPLEALRAAPGGDELVADLLHAAGAKSIGELDAKERHFLENGFGGPSRVPPDVRNAVRAYFSGVEQGLADEFGDKRSPGSAVSLDRALANYMHRMMPVSESAGRRESIADYYNPKPHPSARRGYTRDKHGVALTPQMHDDVRKFRQLVPDDHVYLEVYVPDSTINAGFRHAASSYAMQYLIGRGIIVAGREDFAVTQQGLQNNLEAIGDPFGAPVPAAMAESLTGEGARPRRVHPGIGRFINDYVPFITVGKVDGLKDPWATDDERERDLRLSEAQKVAKDPRVPIEDVGVFERDRYYISPGIPALMFSTGPWGELNDQLLAWERSPVEESIREAWMLKWARGTIGLQTGVVSRKKSARGEMPRFLKTSSTPPRPTGG
jgi:hypothetical protein